MPEGKRNIDSYLDEKLRNSLKSDTSKDFTYELLKRVEIEKEFVKEDVKTYRMAKYIIGGFVTLLTGFVVIFTVLLNINEDGKDASLFNSIVDRFSDFIESVSVGIADILGIALTFQTAAILLILTGCVFLFYFADKLIFRKSLK